MGQEPMSEQGTQRTPEEIRRDIETTRADMDLTMDQLETRVSPSRIRQRQTAKVRDRWTRARESVMGSPDSTSSSSTRDRIRSQGDEAVRMAKDAPDRLEAQTRGNPLAAGAIAFGVGALVGSLLPASDTEQQAARRLREHAEEPVKQELKDAGQRSKDELQPAAQDAAQQTKERAANAAQATKDEAQDRAQNVQERAREGTDRARNT